MSSMAIVSSTDDDSAFVRRALSGDRWARTKLIRRLMPVVLARVRRISSRSGSTNSTDDLVQEVWLKLFAADGKKLLAFAPERGSTLEGFVGLIAEREAIRCLRTTGAKRRGGHLRMESTDDRYGHSSPLPDPAASPEAVTETSDLVTRLGDHLQENLPERGRLVWRFVFTDGLEPMEAARVMGVKVQVVYNWQHKIRGLAREFLARAQA